MLPYQSVVTSPKRPVQILRTKKYAEGEVCIHINQEGRAFVNESDNTAIIYDFGELPDKTLWSQIIDKLCDDGLFAELREACKENCIFISWV